MTTATLDRKKVLQQQKVETNAFAYEGYMTVEEFRNWGHKMVDNKFGK